MNLKRSSASRGELTKAMSATRSEVLTLKAQMSAVLAGMQQLMDGQAALGEFAKYIDGRVIALESDKVNG